MVMNNWLTMIYEHAKIQELRMNFPYPDVWDLLPIAILCVISIFCTVLWLLVIWEYMWLKNKKRCITEDHR